MAYHHGNLREALIRAALDGLESGGAIPSLRALAAACDVSRAAPYRHFDSFEALQAAVAAECFRRLTAAVADATGGIDAPPERLRAGCEAYLDYGLAHPAWYALMFGDFEIKAHPEVDAASAEAFGTLVEAMRRCGVAAPEREATTAWCALHGAVDLLRQRLLPAPFTHEDRAVTSDVLDMVVDRARRATRLAGDRAG